MLCGQMEHLPAFFFFESTGGASIKERKREQRTRVNDMIRIAEVRVIDSDGSQLGVMPTADAKKIAEERELDLVEIAPHVRPPVCKIMDFGKYKYEQSKKAHETKKKQHVTHLKEIKIRPKIEGHDLDFKLKHAENFLLNRDKVKFTVVFRGREMDHLEMGYALLKKVTARFTEIAVVEKEATRVGRMMSRILGPTSERRKGGGEG